MKKCKTCEDPVEDTQYQYCFDCWWAKDPRTIKTMNKDLDMVWAVFCNIESGPKVEGQRDKFEKLRKYLSSFTETFRERERINGSKS